MHKTRDVADDNAGDWFCFLEKMKNGEVGEVMTIEDSAANSPHKSDGNEMPVLSPPHLNYKLQATMPDLLHSGT